MCFPWPYLPWKGGHGLPPLILQIHEEKLFLTDHVTKFGRINLKSMVSWGFCSPSGSTPYNRLKRGVSPKIQVIYLFNLHRNQAFHSSRNHSPLQAFKTAVHHHLLSSPSKSSIFSTPDNPPKPTSFKFPAFLPESPCNVHLLFPMFPVSSLSLPQIS